MHKDLGQDVACEVGSVKSQTFAELRLTAAFRMYVGCLVDLREGFCAWMFATMCGRALKNKRRAALVSEQPHQMREVSGLSNLRPGALSTAHPEATRAWRLQSIRLPPPQELRCLQERLVAAYNADVASELRDLRWMGSCR